MKKILFIGDSSLLARKEVHYDDIYSTLIKKRFNNNYEVEISGKTQNTSKEIFINLDAFMLYGYKPNIVILNYGIVDVFPRPYPNKLSKLLGCLGLLVKIDKTLKKTGAYYKLGDLFKFKTTSIEKFKFYTEGIIDKLLDNGVDKIIIIGIIKPYKVLKKSKIVDTEVCKYNDVYKNMAKNYNQVKYIDVYGDSDEQFTIWDGYHYSSKASQYLSKEIESLIEDD